MIRFICRSILSRFMNLVSEVQPGYYYGFVPPEFGLMVLVFLTAILCFIVFRTFIRFSNKYLRDRPSTLKRKYGKVVEVISYFLILLPFPILYFWFWLTFGYPFSEEFTVVVLAIFAFT
jgi:hypothetical protein